MKRIIFLLTFFALTISVNAQLYVQVFDIGTGQPKLIPYVAGVTNISGTSLKQLDSVSVLLKNFTNTSVGNVQTWASNTFALKGTTATGEGQIINLPDQTPYKIFRPYDYGVTYDDGTQVQDYNFFGYSTHKNVSYPNGVLSNTPDQVIQFEGYNSYDNGARKSTKDISMSRRWERRYWIDGMGLCSEYHFIEETMMDSITRRLMSGYYPINGGPGFVAMELGHFDLNEPATRQAAAKNFFSVDRGLLTLTSTAPGRAAGITLKHYDGTQMQFSFTGGVPVLSMINPAAFGGGSFTYSYGEWYVKTRNGNVSYASDTDAKAAGFKPGESYWKRLSDGTEVISRVK